jgi:GTP-binding protein HflX
MSKNKLYETITHPKTLILGIQAPYNKTNNIESYYEEFIHLIESNNIVYDQSFFTKIREVDPAYFLSKGKLEDVRALCEKEGFEEVIISEPLTPKQERNLSELFHCRVFDRTQLILEIFEKSAHSAEGKLQVSIALLQHKRSRTAGKGVHMSQQSGHIGGKGPGETAKEKEMRIIDDDILKLKRQLKDLAKSRDVQRKRRLENQVPLICLMGYTNTGKSTLLNQLTKAEVLAQDRLFATLDTTTRELYINHKKKGLVSDTVGFIQLLPHSLIDAFKSTLDELRYADLLLHVVDISDANWKEHIAVVNEILEDLNISQEILYVFNKADKEEAQQVPSLELDLFQPHVLVSAKTKAGVEPLIEFLANWNKKSN